MRCQRGFLIHTGSELFVCIAFFIYSYYKYANKYLLMESLNAIRIQLGDPKYVSDKINKSFT